MINSINLKSTILLALMSTLIPSLLLAQQTIFLKNSSFEGMAAAGATPPGWYDCGFPGESPPDTHPSGAFQVTKPAFEGNTYLGMVTRGNDTWERVSQVLDEPLKAGQCYDFQIYLAMSSSYWSASSWNQEYDNYTEPIVLRIWGGNSYCDRKERLAETKVVDHSDWQAYDLKLKPRRDLNYIMLEVYYQIPTLFPYNGNILIDKASPIVACGEEFPELLVEDHPLADKPVNVKPVKPEPPKPKDPPVQPERVVEADSPAKTPPTEKEEILIPELKKPGLVEGQIIKVNELNFEADTFNLKEEVLPVLDEIFDFLNDNPDVAVEIGGHTNGLPTHPFCDRLSKNRAESVVNYLLEKGIEPERIKAVGYGKRKPIASNRTLEGRKKNQRVEIKILSIGSK